MFFLRLFCALVVASMMWGSSHAQSTGDCGSAETTIYLVRHAEKVKDQPNPLLTESGRARARVLVEHLSGAGLTKIFSTNYRRTLLTAQPAAEATGLNVTLYDPSRLDGFAKQLKATPGTYLVVGHSNTTPQLVELLGGEPGTPIYEPTEYDRLYRVDVCADRSIRSQLTRYGAPYVPGR